MKRSLVIGERFLIIHNNAVENIHIIKKVQHYPMQEEECEHEKQSSLGRRMGKSVIWCYFSHHWDHLF
jgi:hypothetical protein